MIFALVSLVVNVATAEDGKKKAKDAGVGNAIPTDWLTQIEVP